MKLRSILLTASFAAGFGALAAPALAQDHPGQAIYQQRCATCHDNPGTTRAATLSVIQGTAAETLKLTLTEGLMQPMAAGLSEGDLGQLIGWLTKDQKAEPKAWNEAMMCAPDKRTVNLSAPAGSPQYGVDVAATRNVSAKDAGLGKADMKNLELAWAVGVPRSQGMSAAPVTVGDTVFANMGGFLMALDADEGCAKWTYAGGASRAPMVFGEIAGRKALIYTAGRGDVHTVDALTGELIWKASGQPRNGSGGSVRPAVTLYQDKIIVPISASGVGGGGASCCAGHGSVVALNANDGSWLWEYHTMKEAEENGQVNAQGQKQRGPSGAPIWSTPSIDAKRNRVLVTTGENTSWPATNTSDSVISLDLDTGLPVWNFQAMESDVWNMHCRTNDADSGANCPWHFDDENIGRDFDFGGSAIVTRTKGGLFGIGAKDIVLVGQKSGHLWALDPNTGKVLWSQRVGEGSALGGNHWGIAIDGTRAFLTINDPLPGEAPVRAGVYAFNISDGKPVWSYEAKPDCGGERGKLIVNCETKYGFSATPLVVGGALVAGTLDGKLFTFDAKTGAVLNIIDTAGPVKTANGVEGKGGSIDSTAISAGSGMILVGSGYGSFSQTPGNVLMAFKPKK